MTTTMIIIYKAGLEPRGAEPYLRFGLWLSRRQPADSRQRQITEHENCIKSFTVQRKNLIYSYLRFPVASYRQITTIFLLGKAQSDRI